MSRAFVKETDNAQTQVVAPRADLPQGAINYVTPNGLKLLNDERQSLEQARQQSQDPAEKRYLDDKLHLLKQRIESAVLVENHATDKVRFGVSVALYKEKEDCECVYQIVGVDEANAKQHKISYLSPIAQALMNKQVGDTVLLQTPKGLREMDIENIFIA